jgi:hypothetical protein
MSKLSLCRSAACAALILSVALVSARPSRADGGWGTVTGQVVYGAQPYPDNGEAKVDKDQAHCLSKGPILKNDWVINKKNGGIRWALVWLTEADNPKSTKALPIHPALKNMPRQVEIDQPCCVFEPRVLGMRVGQDLVIKNSAPIPHNTYMNGGSQGPNINPLIASKGQFVLEAKKIKPRSIPIMYSCSIHGWMKGYIGVFDHPYFAVSDADGKFTIKNAPAGKYRLMVWHEQGWVIIDPKNLANRGKVIAIKANGTTDVGKIKFVPLKDD